MAAWPREKRLATEKAFYAFLDNAFIFSKERGRICVGKELYDGQRRVITEIFNALEEDIHSIAILKSRQLGISTIIRLLTTFLIGLNPGMQGAIVFDTDDNKIKARTELETVISELPARLKFPHIAKNNRQSLILAQKAEIIFKSAGVTVKKSGGGLGRSIGLSFLHACMALDTLVIVEDGRLLPIKDVRVGQRVLTHTGALARVEANTIQVNPRGTMLRISPWLGTPFECTEEHKIPTRRGLIHAGELRMDDELVMPVRQIKKEQTLSVLPQTPLRPQNGGAVAVAAGKEIELDEEVGFAVGYYLAEGCLIYQGRGANYGKNPSGITFARHPTEAAYAERACAALEPFSSGSRNIYQSKKSLTVTETIYGAALACWLDANFGARDEKHIPDDVFKYGEEFCRGLLAGLLCGDGSKTHSRLHQQKEYVLNSVALTSTRASIALQARDLAASLGYGWASFKRRAAGAHYGRNCKESFTIRWHGSAAARLRELMGLPVAAGGRPRTEKYLVEDGRIFIQIRKIENGIRQPFMCDLAVDHADHTFRLPSAAVSNSELCMWADKGGLEALQNSLAEQNPDRLYIYESTAKGYNLWYDLWQEMKDDPLHCKTIFIGWWAHDLQRIDRDHRDFPVYGSHAPTKEEKEKMEVVRTKYGVTITQEQLAWVRRKYDPGYRVDGDKKKEETSSERIQEQPWTEDEAFRTSGAIFFSNQKLTDQSNKWVLKPLQSYAFLAGEEFVNMRIAPPENNASLELKVWEEPQPDSYYAIGVDPAFGENPTNDRSSIQVFRCYADGCDQVAEYAFAMVNTRQLAWVVASLCGWYGAHPRNEVRYVLELNGPGTAVWNELRSLKQQIETGYPPLAIEDGLRNYFRNVQAYLRMKEDSLGPASNWHIKTTPQSKVADLETLRDFVSNGQLHIRSRALIDEMATITREESKLGAPPGKKDDRVLAAAFATRCWVHKIRPKLVVQRLTREAVRAKTDLKITDQVFLFNQNHMDMYFREKQMIRLRAQAGLRQRSLWGRR